MNNHHFLGANTLCCILFSSLKYIAFVLIYSLVCTQVVSAFATGKYLLNSGWFFYKNPNKIAMQDIPKQQAEPVQIPHSYNTEDAFYTNAKMYRGEAWYFKKVNINKSDEQEVFLHFEGVLQYAEVYVNGVLAGTHKGGYTAFTLSCTHLLTDALFQEIAVKVDNSHRQDIAPLSGDFTRYGGIYRDVYVIYAPKTHFELNTLGGVGIKITTPLVKENKAKIKINYSLKNYRQSKQKRSINVQLIDAKGKVVLSKLQSIVLAPGLNTIDLELMCEKPMLWSPDNPYLYTVIHQLLDSKNRIIDSHVMSLGFRWLTLDNERGVFLNGKPIKLIGACRHQDLQGSANALENYRHDQDIKLIKDMGMNFIRMSHYPHDKALLEACDRLGILVWKEIPIVDLIDTTNVFREHAKVQLKEMIAQYGNYSSVVMWGFMNEILLGIDRYLTDPELKQACFKKTPMLAKELNELAKQIDPDRLTTIAHHGDIDLYEKWGMNTITDIVGYNCYPGWYGGTTKGFTDLVEKFHLLHPEKALLISEYGAGSDKRIHSLEPVSFDFSMEYQPEYIYDYLETMDKRPWITGSSVWLLNDFASEIRDESMPRINNKGLLYMNREKKDIYYLYKARYNNSNPMVHIATRDWPVRTFWKDTTTVRFYIYSNQPEVTVAINALEEKTYTTQGGRVLVTFTGIPNVYHIRARAGSAQDQSTVLIKQQKKPSQPDFQAIYVNMGTKATYHTPHDGPIWLPELPYTVLGIGYLGGEPVKYGERMGTTADIKGTTDDPLFQTARKDPESILIDMAPGTYDIEVHFVLFGNKNNILNDVGEPSKVNASLQSAFEIYVQDEKVAETTDFISEYGLHVPYKFQYTYTSIKPEKVVISFKNTSGTIMACAFSCTKKW